jgi:hypothetical protein
MSLTARVAPPRNLPGHALHAEWTKFRTAAGPAWLLAGVVALTVAVGAAAASVAQCSSARCGIDPATVSAPADAMTVLVGAGAEVALTCSGVLSVAGLSPEATVSVLAGHAIPVSEVTTHQATLEEAYMELTRELVEYRAEAAS